MTGLLVSVRSAAEAQAALAGGATIIDVKEPLRGPLGAADPAVWQAVASTVGNKASLSAALGELLEWNAGGFPVEALQSYRFAKLGLAGCARVEDWETKWEQALAMLPEHIEPVAVVYGDYAVAEAPSPLEIFQVGKRLGCRALLFDTFAKSRGNLFQAISATKLNSVVQAAQGAGLLTVLAGSLSLLVLDSALAFQPNFVGVRGAVCQGSREAMLQEELVRSWADRLAGWDAMGLSNPRIGQVGS